ncbi:MAG: prephenate dehydrogenase [Halobacteriaceae archaeon]
METLVVGAGVAGRWFADVVGDDVAFADVEEAAAETAADRIHRQHGRQGRVVDLDTEESFGLVCIAVPLPEAATAVRRHAAKAQTAVVDVTGVMEAPLAAMAAVAPARERASYHPLFDPGDPPGRVAVARGAEGPVTDRIERAMTDAGNDVVPIAADRHDEAMATIQGRAHAAVLAFGLAAADVPDELATPVYEELQSLVGRITDGNPRVYRDIQATFGGAAEIADTAATLADADATAFEDLFDDAGR